MPEDKLAVVRMGIDALARRDKDAWLLFTDPEVEFRADPSWPESQTVRGCDAVWDITVSIVDAWEEAPSEVVEVVDPGDERLALRIKQLVRGKASGVETEFDYWWVGTFREGRVLRSYWFVDRASALEAAGVTE